VESLQTARAEAVKGVGRGRAQDDGDGRDRNGDDERVADRLPDLGRAEELRLEKRAGLKELATRIRIGR
jgi:hypothetical protein